MPLGELRPFKMPDLATTRAVIRELHCVLRNCVAFKVHKMCSLQAGWLYQIVGCTTGNYYIPFNENNQFQTKFSLPFCRIF